MHCLYKQWLYYYKVHLSGCGFVMTLYHTIKQRVTTTIFSGPCRSSPCQNGLLCKYDPSDPGGYNGYTCVDVYCTNNPCKNGGICSNTPTGPVCQCPPQWTGPLCDSKYSPIHYGFYQQFLTIWFTNVPSSKIPIGKIKSYFLHIFL